MFTRSLWSATLLAAVPALAFAWSPPYAPEAPVPGPYYGYPGGYPGAYPQPYAMPAAPEYPGGWMRDPYAAPPPPPPVVERQPAAEAPQAPGPDWRGYGRPLSALPMIPHLDVSRQMDGDAYLIDIRVQNIEPDQVKIQPTRRGLVISYSKSAQVDREDRLPGGEGYRRSYSISRGVTTRRIGLPADAKLDAMEREESDGRIRLRIPRAAVSQPGAW
ncbi:Hsp20/alpha crystallin family protein [Thiorhodococcus mannitoliphagus]|uniref:Hsp20/alpha crystallin family protein n=1 Tax=Thiorhodococcus mannitoliphagus TaxID=329406 RepID=A0A6P1DYD3_9GAMM|nr:Hsp20/alpha crystallin family protein [Thiorhodococcus mannitoliphagus]NEX21726.1 Hsp20/alpha crystallin family protein [Thiorhodococcus mannitoliphagus]